MGIFSFLNFGSSGGDSSYAMTMARNLREHGGTGGTVAPPAKVPGQALNAVQPGISSPQVPTGQKEIQEVGQVPTGPSESLLPSMQAKYETTRVDGAAYEIEAERNPMFRLSNARHGDMPDISHVNKELLGRFAATEKEAGVTLPILSGYRGPTYNKQHGGVRRSQHIQGNAIDVDVRHLTRDQQVVVLAAARKHGIQGIGVYSKNDSKANSLHFDIGPRRAWGPSTHWWDVPHWAREVLGVTDG